MMRWVLCILEIEELEENQWRFSEYVVEILAKEKKDVDRCTTIPCTHGLYEVISGKSQAVHVNM